MQIGGVAPILMTYPGYALVSATGGVIRRAGGIFPLFEKNR
jgi:hypothetical protein